ncbi:ion transporter [Gracilimonas halophila]|uniref:Ion transporter n=1 Tax=Gracilimonas halophila TaxID=1834464 RepID=A0ABW5JMA1_9BACT
MRKIKSKLNALVNDSHTKWGARFAYTIQALIIYSLVTFSFSTLPNLSKGTLLFLEISRYATVAIFSLEYMVRIWVAENRWKYIFSFYGLVDLVAILPFYLSMTIDLRSFRIIRVLRVFRLIKITKYSKAIKRFKYAFKDVKEELVIFLTATLFLLYISAVGIYYFENAVQPENFTSIFHSLWWAVATLTTVGYGDVYPITTGGKIFTFFVLMIGLGLVAAPAGIIATAMEEAHKAVPDKDINIQSTNTQKELMKRKDKKSN